MGTRDQTHCRHGHEFTPENTYWKRRKARGNRNSYVSRECRACALEMMKDYDTYKRDPQKQPKKRRL